MKYLGKKPSGQDKEILVPMFVFNDDEVLLLETLLGKAYMYMPKLYQPDRARLRHMYKRFGEYIRGSKLEATKDLAKLMKQERRSELDFKESV